jgi:hypothetical protein
LAVGPGVLRLTLADFHQFLVKRSTFLIDWKHGLDAQFLRCHSLRCADGGHHGKIAEDFSVFGETQGNDRMAGGHGIEVKQTGLFPVLLHVGIEGRKFSKAKSIAERLDICSRTIFRWADGGKITRHKINAHVVLFDEVEVIAFMSARVD